VPPSTTFRVPREPHEMESGPLATLRGGLEWLEGPTLEEAGGRVRPPPWVGDALGWPSGYLRATTRGDSKETPHFGWPGVACG
jgi:hypothetical protein